MSTISNAPWIARQATRLLAQRGHAWLLQGPSGLGQYDLALAMASAWLCEKPTPGGACGDCPSCHAIAVRTHADLAVLMPETVMLALGWPLSEKAQDEIDKKTRKPSKEILKLWVPLCQELNVLLIWPDEFRKIKAFTS